MISIKDKVVVVIGASGGMGQIICKELVNEGVKFALSSNDQASLEQLADSVKQSGADVISKVCDVTNEADVVEFFFEISKKYGKADILLNLAGLSIPGQVSEMNVEKYDLNMDVNLKGTFLSSKHFIPLTNLEDGGQIINIGSMAAKRANPNAPLYCTAKAAVNMFSQGLALQLKDKNIRVTTLNPGPTNTTFWGDRNVPREKFMQAEDVAEVMLFLLKMNSRVVFHEVDFESFEFFK